jgi:2-polyprenyl-3-methyl-5-hydroxy-6-metoxy-1,4-benzoquinol methylase
MTNLNNNGWGNYNIWQHSQSVKDLYRTRANKTAPEMTCAAQAVRILTPYLSNNDSLLDAGCGAGYLYHSFQQTDLEIDYYGIDATQDFIDIGREELPQFGLEPDHLECMRIEDLDGLFDVSVCLNVLSNIDNYHRPLERLLKISRKAVLLRDSITEHSKYSYVHDAYLDDDVHLNVHVNSYGRAELSHFVENYGYQAEFITDQHSGGQSEQVIDHPHHWCFMLALPIKEKNT